MTIRFGRLGLSTVNLSLKANHAIRPGMASESRVPVLQCWISRCVVFATGPIYYAHSLDGMVEGITNYLSRIKRSVLSAARKHRMRVSERHFNPTAAAFHYAGTYSDFSSGFQTTRSIKNVAPFQDLSFGVSCASCPVRQHVPTARRKRVGGDARRPFLFIETQPGATLRALSDQDLKS